MPSRKRRSVSPSILPSNSYSSMLFSTVSSRKPKTSPILVAPSPTNSFPPRPTSTAQFYGFVVYLGSIVVFGLYLIWAFLPDRFILALGIDWYPNREWALLLPAWLTMAVVFTYITYASLNIYSTPGLDSLAQIVDGQGNVHPLPKEGEIHPIIQNSMHNLQEGSIPILYDIPIGLVGQVLYGEENAMDQERVVDIDKTSMAM